MRTLFVWIALLAAALGQEPGRILTGTEKTAHFEIRFRPASRAEASVDRVAVAAEQDLQKIPADVGSPTSSTRSGSSSPTTPPSCRGSPEFFPSGDPAVLGFGAVGG